MELEKYKFSWAVGNASVLIKNLEISHLFNVSFDSFNLKIKVRFFRQVRKIGHFVRLGSPAGRSLREGLQKRPSLINKRLWWRDEQSSLSAQVRTAVEHVASHGSKLQTWFQWQAANRI